MPSHAACFRQLLIAAVLAGFALGARPRPALSTPAWWQHAVIYEVYPRSFADSDSTGTGNLQGISAHLGYLQALGVDAVWITPFYPSPQVDFGYDISDYTAIDPTYGSMADFERLVRQARAHHLRIILDMVLNHTSDQHPWFRNSRSSPHARYRDFYVWRNGKLGACPPRSVGAAPLPAAPAALYAKCSSSPPNNWTSLFGGSAWEFDPLTGQYYYHYFYKQQPDLNWRNPAVERAMFAAVRFWLDRGVAGFRLDAVTRMFEDPQLRDNPPGFIRTGDFGAPLQKPVYNDNLPEVHRVLRRLRALADHYHAVLIGETTGSTEAALATYYGKHQDETQLPFNFLFADINRLSAPEFRRHIAAWINNPAHGTPDWFFDNHDQPREMDRYGDGVHNAQIARLLPTLLLTLPGTAVLYYGQEIGMSTHDPATIDQVKDPMGRRWWPQYKGRDGERTPMQWSPGPHAGFTRGTPWLPVPASAQRINVATESADPDSLLHYYQQLIALRRSSAPLRAGTWQAVHGDDPNVLAYVRTSPDQTLLVTLNMSAQVQDGDFSALAKGARQVLDSLPGTSPAAVDLHQLKLQPFEARVLELERRGPRAEGRRP